MAGPDGKEVARRYYEEVLNEGNVAALDELAVAGYIEHDPFPGQGDGFEGLKDRVRMLRDGIAPRFTIKDMVAEGDRVVVRWTSSGTHVGEFLGIPPTNKSFTIEGIDIHRLSDGKLAEHWHVVDQFGMLQQLGLLPVPEGTEA